MHKALYTAIVRVALTSLVIASVSCQDGTRDDKMLGARPLWSLHGQRFSGVRKSGLVDREYVQFMWEESAPLGNATSTQNMASVLFPRMGDGESKRIYEVRQYDEAHMLVMCAMDFSGHATVWVCGLEMVGGDWELRFFKVQSMS